MKNNEFRIQDYNNLKQMYENIVSINNKLYSENKKYVKKISEFSHAVKVLSIELAQINKDITNKINLNIKNNVELEKLKAKKETLQMIINNFNNRLSLYL